MTLRPGIIGPQVDEESRDEMRHDESRPATPGCER